MAVGDSGKKRIEKEVFDILEDICDIPKNMIRLEAKLIDDLRICSDDLSFVYALQLEKKLNIKVPITEWEKVITVKDTIELLYKYS